MFGSVSASFPPLRTEKPPLFFIFSRFLILLPHFLILLPHFLYFVLNFPSSSAHSRIADGELPNTMPRLAFAHSKRGRQFPSGASFHVKLFFAPSREQMYTAVDGESAGQRSRVPSFFPRIAAICCYS